MKRKLLLAFCILLAGFAPAAMGLIKIDAPISRSYAASPRVIVAEVSTITAANRLVDARVLQTLKGDDPGERVRLQVAQPADLFERIRPGGKLVIFVGLRASTIHIADTWSIAQMRPEMSPPTWQISAEAMPLRRSFPGTTDALVRLVADLKAGRSTLIDQIDETFFAGKPAVLGKMQIDAEPLGRASGALADGSMLLESGRLFCGADVQAMAAMKQAGVSGAKVLAVLSQEAGRCTALLQSGELLRIADGAVERVQLLPPEGALESAALGRFGEDDQLCALVVREEGVFRYSLGAGQAPADFQRLTGERSAVYDREGKGLSGGRIIRMDANADGRDDAMLSASAGVLLLINRGYGTMLPIELTQRLGHLADRPWTADADGLVIIDASGTLQKIRCTD